MKIGIDLGGTKTEGILIDSDGNELKRERIKTEKNYDGTINGILSIVKNFEQSFGNVNSIGIGMPGAISADSAFDMPCDEEDDEKAFSPSQYLEDHSFSPEQIVEKQNYESVNHTALMKNISGLDRRAQDIIRARWLDDHKLTLNELADKYSVSAERIRQIEASAFKKLKSSLVNV